MCGAIVREGNLHGECFVWMISASNSSIALADVGLSSLSGSRNTSGIKGLVLF